MPGAPISQHNLALKRTGKPDSRRGTMQACIANMSHYKLVSNLKMLTVYNFADMSKSRQGARAPRTKEPWSS